MKSLLQYITESKQETWTLKFSKPLVNKYDLKVSDLSDIVHKYEGTLSQPKGDGTPIILSFDWVSSGTWNKFLDNVRDMCKELLPKISYEDLLKFAESGEHEEIYQVVRDEVEK